MRGDFQQLLLGRLYRIDSTFLDSGFRIPGFRVAQHRGKTCVHALTSALPVCTCGSIAQINVVVPLAVCQLVVANQQPRMKEKKGTQIQKIFVDDSLLQY